MEATAKKPAMVLENTIIGAAASIRIREFIRANLPLAAVPSAPEIQVHKAAPTSGLRRLADADDSFGAPYWAYHWGGGLALARHVLDNRELVAGRTVLDLGAGSGIVGIAAAKAGARHVIAADTDAYAIEAVGLNAQANGVRIATLHSDLTRGSPPDVDLVLVGDLFYDAGLAQRVAAFLDRCLASGIEVLVGDPGRTFLPRDRLELVDEYAGVDFGSGDNGTQTRNAVFAYKPPSRK
jgi:predicted nicotinamide N-methyase